MADGMRASEAVFALGRFLPEESWRTCRLDREASFLDEGQVRAVLAVGSGYVVYTDEVARIAEGVDPARRILAADVVKPGGASSVQVRWDGDRYLVTTFVEGPGDEHIALDESHLSVHPGQQVRYRVYLAPVPEGEQPVGVWRPIAARFLGFAAVEEDV